MAGAIVQTKEASTSGSATTIASGSLGSNVSAGNKLWIVVNAGDNQTITVTQNSGTATLGTITSQGSVQEAGVLDKTEHFTCDVTGSGSLDVLATFGATTDRRGILVVEVSGIDAVDGSAETTDTGNNPTPNSTINVTTQPAFGLNFATFFQGGTPTVGSGWTDAGTFWSGVANARLQSRAINATGNVTGNFGNASFDRNNAVMVVWLEPTPPTITSQPGPQPIIADAGQSITLTIAATGTGSVTYQWRELVAGTWTDLTGETSTTLNRTAGSAGTGASYLCRVTDSNGFTDSQVVAVIALSTGIYAPYSMGVGR